MEDEDKYNKRKRNSAKKDPIKIMLEQLQSGIPHIGKENTVLYMFTI